MFEQIIKDILSASRISELELLGLVVGAILMTHFVRARFAIASFVTVIAIAATTNFPIMHLFGELAIGSILLMYVAAFFGGGGGSIGYSIGNTSVDTHSYADGPTWGSKPQATPDGAPIDFDWSMQAPGSHEYGYNRGEDGQRSTMD